MIQDELQTIEVFKPKPHNFFNVSPFLNVERKFEWVCLSLQDGQKEFGGINSLKDWETRLESGPIPEEQISSAFECLVDLTASDYEV